MSKHILILGAGYGGLLGAISARAHFSPEEAAITVINKYDTHQIITELHRLAVGNVAEKAVALPLANLFKGKAVNLRIGTVTGIDPDARRVDLEDGTALTYDALVLALGSESNFFGVPGLEEHSFTLKSVADAKRIYGHINDKLAAYARTKRKADATFVIGGGGLTGVELAGELADELPGLCRAHGVDFADVALYLVESKARILATYSDDLIDRATSSLEARGVRFLTGLTITEAKGTTVSLKDGRTIEAGTVLWAGGVKGSPLVANCGIEVDRGRASVNAYLQSVSHPDVFLAGDCAAVMGPNGVPYPPTAQLSWQMGEHVGSSLFAYFKGAKMTAFEPVNSGSLASLGRKDGIGWIGESGIELKGSPATLMKKASDVRYLSHIHGLSTLAY
ncbi:NAD(P)/FAD-dependent oxidoreductase [Paenibacillus sp. MWE-103]|uniref:NAD(P)/FAD-dependent oxidoreductase n=1 Tax=Paenibacillus artemisiicola TaxID=1172618 RepID=A0ABS3W5B4_9BACL|nr:NAD(P)/FAD-dependent oxidoreductase [Paenibacillus artemisiicola]MBO7743480.1 NAD(P)/FAD-dependent oxidoreductase [Paenibacillus artemisiicola]